MHVAVRHFRSGRSPDCRSSSSARARRPTRSKCSIPTVWPDGSSAWATSSPSSSGPKGPPTRRGVEQQRPYSTAPDNGEAIPMDDHSNTGGGETPSENTRPEDKPAQPAEQQAAAPVQAPAGGPSWAEPGVDPADASTSGSH